MATKDIQLVLTFTDKGTGKVKKVVVDVTKALKTAGQEAGKTGKGFKTMQDQVAKTTKGVSKFKKMMKSTVGQMAMGLGMFTGVTAAVRGVSRAVTDTIKTGREFERTWANVTTMLTVSEGETKRLHDELLNLSPTLGDTTDLAKGMYQVLSASIEPAKAIKFLAEAAKSAKAGVTDTATAVDALTTIINAYGMQAEDVTKVSDIMFQTVKRGKLTYEGMAGALGTIAPMAAQMGISFESIGAAMATLTRQGIDVNTTTVQLRQIMVSVLKPTSEAQKMAKALGIEFSAAAMKSKGLVNFLKDLSEKTGGSATAMTALFGNVRALTGVLGLAGVKSAEFASDLKLMEDAAGATEVAFQKQMKSADFWMDTLKNTVKKLQIAFYEGLVEPFKKGIKSADDLDAKVAKLTKTVHELGNAITSTVLTLKTFAEAQKLTAANVQTNLKWSERFAKWLTEKLGGAYKTGAQLADENRKKAEEFMKTLQVLEPTMDELKEVVVKGDKAWADYTKRVLEADKSLREKNETMVGTWGAMHNMIIAQKKAISAMIEEGYSYEQIRKLAMERKGMLTEEQQLAQAKAKWTAALTAGTKKYALEGLEPLAKKLKEATDFMKQYGKSLDPEQVRKMEGVIKGLTEQLKKQNKGFEAAIPKVKTFYDIIGIMPGAIEDMADKTQYASERLEDLGYSLQDMINFMDMFLRMISMATGVSLPSFGAGLEQLDFSIKKVAGSTSVDWQQLVDNMTTHWMDGIAEMIAGTRNFSDIMQNLFSQIGAGAGSMVQQLISGISGLGKMAGPIGAIAGGLVAGLGGLLGGLFKKKPRKTEKQRLEEELDMMVDQMRKALKTFGDISDATLEKIAQLRQEGVGGWTAITLNFADVIRDAGVNVDNFTALTQRALSAVDEYNRGLITAAQAGDVLNDSFELLLEGAKKIGKEGSAELVKFVKTIRQSGIEVKAVTDYVLEQLDRIPAALSTLIDNMRTFPGFIPDKVMNKLETKAARIAELYGKIGPIIGAFDYNAEQNKKWGERIAKNVDRVKELMGKKLVKTFENWMEINKKGWGDLSEFLAQHEDKTGKIYEKMGKKLDAYGKIASMSFQAMIASGRSYMKTLEVMKEPLTKLKEKYEELGRDVPDMLKPMFDLMEKMELKPKVFENLDAATELLHALRNSAYMTQDSFDTLAVHAKKFAKVILDVEGNLFKAVKTMEMTPEQIQQLLPIVSQFVGTAAMFGLDIPAWMRGFVKTQLKGISWKEFKERAAEQANAGISTVEQLKKLNDIAKAQKSAMKEGLNKLGDRNQRYFDKLGDRLIRAWKGTPGAAAGVRVSSPQFMQVGEQPERIIPERDIRSAVIAQGGGDWRVTKDEQAFIAHRGENVAITPTPAGDQMTALLTKLIEMLKAGGTAPIIFAPQINGIFDDQGLAELMENKLFPEFVKLVDTNKGGKRTEARQGLRIE